MAKSSEAFWWSWFSAGGMIAAMVLPALILITGFLLPFADGVAYEQLLDLASHWLARLFLFAVLALGFLHAAHRLRLTVDHLGVHGGRSFIAVLCYGGAIAGTVAAGFVVFRL